MRSLGHSPAPQGSRGQEGPPGPLAGDTPAPDTRLRAAVRLPHPRGVAPAPGPATAAPVTGPRRQRGSPAPRRGPCQGSPGASRCGPGCQGLPCPSPAVRDPPSRSPSGSTLRSGPCWGSPPRRPRGCPAVAGDTQRPPPGREWGCGVGVRGMYGGNTGEMRAGCGAAPRRIPARLPSPRAAGLRRSQSPPARPPAPHRVSGSAAGAEHGLLRAASPRPPGRGRGRGGTGTKRPPRRGLSRARRRNQNGGGSCSAASESTATPPPPATPTPRPTTPTARPHPRGQRARRSRLATPPS